MAELKTQLKTDLVAAMKAHDELRKNTLRSAISAIGTAEVAGESARELSQDEEQAVVNAQVRSRHDSAQAYTDGGRPELAEQELAEAAILQAYLPAPLTDDELTAMVAEELAAAAAGGEAPSMKQMGQIVKAVNARAKGRAQGGTVAALVKQALQS